MAIYLKKQKVSIGGENIRSEVSEQEALLTRLETEVNELTDKPSVEVINAFQNKCDITKSLHHEFYVPNLNGVVMKQADIIELMKNINTSKVVCMNYMFAYQFTTLDDHYIDLSEIIIDGSNCQYMNNMFRNAAELKKLPTIINAKPKQLNYFCGSCRSLEEGAPIDTSLAIDLSGMYDDCSSLKRVYNYDVSNATDLSYIYYKCPNIEDEIEFSFLQSNVNLNYAFYNCKKIPKIIINNSQNVTNYSNTFSGCNLLTDLTLDLINAKYISNIIKDTTNMTNLYLKNIKLSLAIGSGTIYGHLLTDDSIVNTFKELHDMTGSTAPTLTLSTPSGARTEVIYVKLIDITDEMRADDEYIDNKKPCVICESTDDGAMTLKEYGISKNWNISY